MCKKKLKIIFDGTMLAHAFFNTSRRSGIYFATYNILKELCSRDDVELLFYTEPQNYQAIYKFISANSDLKNCKVYKSKSILNKIDFFKMLKSCSDKKNDNLLKKTGRFIIYRILNHNKIKIIFDKNLERLGNEYDCYLSTLDLVPAEIEKNKNIKKFVFLYDAIPIIMKDFYKGIDDFKWFFNLIKSINKNDYYFTISDCTKNDFIKNIPEIDPEKITVTYLGANENFYQVKDLENIKQVKNKYNIPSDKKYIFSLCTLEPRKNLIFAIKNFIKFINKNQIEDFIIVLGGGHWNKFMPELEKEIANFNEYKDKFLKIGYVDDEDLAALYSGAEMFVYPSLYEGFGMPVLEAMQCGCPVITSNISSLPEVIGDCGIQIDPYKDEELVAAYEKMYFDKDFREKCREKGLEHAKDFSWKNCVDKIIDTMLKCSENR